MVVSKFGACFTIGKLIIDGFCYNSVSWELCNVVLLVAKALSSRGQEIKAVHTNIMTGQPLLFNS